MKTYSSQTLLIAFVVETFCVSYGLPLLHFSPVVSILYFVSGMVMAFCGLNVRPQASSLTLQTNARSALSYKISAFAVLIVATWFLTNRIIETHPLKIEEADMLPIIKAMNERFLQGQWQQVYDPVNSVRGGTLPVYLPAMWMPFSIAVATGIDPRWITAAGTFLGFGAFIFVFSPTRKNTGPWIVSSVALMLYLWLFTGTLHGLVSLTEEGVVLAYYALLCVALIRKNIFFIGLLSGLCLLSRYAFIGWVPAFFLFLLLYKKRKEALVFSVTILAAFMVLFLFPFGWDAVKQALTLPRQYIGFATRVWTDSPDVFEETVGLARFFGAGHTKLLHTMLILGSVLLPGAFVAYAWIRKKGDEVIVPLCALKFSLVYFYCFLDVPYLYLFYTSSIGSLVMMGYLFSNSRRSFGVQ